MHPVVLFHAILAASMWSALAVGQPAKQPETPPAKQPARKSGTQTPRQCADKDAALGAILATAFETGDLETGDWGTCLRPTASRTAGMRMICSTPPR